MWRVRESIPGYFLRKTKVLSFTTRALRMALSQMANLLDRLREVYPLKRDRPSCLITRWTQFDSASDCLLLSAPGLLESSVMVLKN